MSHRISLTRVIAINWYGFNQIFDVEDTTLISGAFGTGKSALLDLIQHVMLGDGWKANRAASGSKSRGRDLVGYCLCDTNHEQSGERHFLRRSGATVIALEFSKPVDRGESPERETWGMRIEYTNPTAQPKKTHFVIPDRAEYENLLEGESLLDDERFRTWLRREYGKDCLFARQKDYLEEMGTARHLYFDTKSFRLTFPKAIAFEPEDNVEKFIREFILEESPLNVTEVRESLQAYEDVRRRLESQEDEAAFLRKIKQHHDACQKAKRQGAVLEHVEVLLTVTRHEEIRDRHQAEIQRLESANRENLKRLTESKDLRQVLDKQLSEAAEVLSADPEAKKLDALQKLIAEQRNRLKTLQDAWKGVRRFLEDRQRDWIDWLRHGESLKIEGLEKGFKEAAETVDALSAGNEKLGLEKLEGLAEAFQGIWRQTELILQPLKNDKEKLDTRLRRIQEDLARLEDNQTPGRFPLFDLLRERLGDKVRQLGRVVEVKPEADPWWPVLEALFGDERWTIVPADSDTYRKSLDLLSEISPESGEAILNPAELNGGSSPGRTGSVMEMLDFPDDRARKRLEALFGDIVCVADAPEAEAASSNRALSRDGYFKDVPVRRRLRTEEVAFTLGRRGLERMRRNLLSEQEQVQGEIEGIERRISDIQTWLEKGQEKRLGSQKKPDGSEEIGGIAALEKELGSNEETLKLLETPERLERVKRHGELKTKRDEIIGTIRVLQEKLANFETEVAPHREGREKAVAGLEALNLQAEESRAALASRFSGVLDAELEELREYWMARGAGWNERYEELRGERTQADTDAVQHKSERDGERRLLREARDDHGSLRHPHYQDFDVSEDDNTQWDQRLARLETVELERNRSLAESRKQEWQRRLQDQVLNELTRRMQDAEAVIRSLRKHLSQPVGNYRYEIRQRRDNTYENLWRLLDSGFEGTDPLAQVMQEAEVQSALEELMAAVNAGADAKDRAARLLDYRNYHRYDIEMIPVGENASKGISLSRSGRNLSGGESQAPFFISMLAAFRRVYNRGDRRSRQLNQLGLVVMDEAFSKLSSDGIADCLTLARSFGLQLILAFPPEKLGVMVEHARTVIVCQKELRHDAQGLPVTIENIPIRMTLDEALEALD